MRIIGLLGAAGSGKSAVSNYLVDKYGARKYAFADPLKAIAQRVFDFTHEQLWGTQEQKETVDPRYGFSPRWLLQRLGTQGIREVFGPDVWWSLCLERILEDRPALAVVEDFRFVNEVEGFLAINDAVKDSGEPAPVMIWRIESPVKISNADPTHASETQWSECRFTDLIAPKVYGLLPLFNIVDEITAESGLVETTKSYGQRAGAVTDEFEMEQPTSFGALPPEEADPRCLRDIGEDRTCERPWNHEPDAECRGWSGVG